MCVEIEKATTTERGISQHWATHGHLNSFKKKIAFKGVNYLLIKDFDHYLRKQDLKESTIYGHHKRLRHYVHEAVKHGYIQPKDDPYSSFKLRTVKYETIKYLERNQN